MLEDDSADKDVYIDEEDNEQEDHVAFGVTKYLKNWTKTTTTTIRYL